MKVISSPKALQNTLSKLRRNKTIGFVPTMGYLHAGHLELVRQARKHCDVVVVSIFVNPLQFGPKEDFSKYPRDEKRDLKLLEKAGVDFVFLPEPADLYPKDFQTEVKIKSVSQGLCGESRPGHFAGVATVVLKLFNLVQPHQAYFGEKDYQQLVVIQTMVRDLNVPVKIVGVPIVRDLDGLALSSRNVYLSEEGRRLAVSIPRGLGTLRDVFQKQARLHTGKAKLVFIKSLPKHPEVRLDYVACVHRQTLLPLKQLKKDQTLVAVAVYVGKTRLIDNILL